MSTSFSRHENYDDDDDEHGNEVQHPNLDNSSGGGGGGGVVVGDRRRNRKRSRSAPRRYSYYFLLQIIDDAVGTMNNYIAPLECASVARLKEKIAFCAHLERDWIHAYASMQLAAAFRSRVDDDSSESVFTTKMLIDVAADAAETRFDLREVITDADMDEWDCVGQPSAAYSDPPAVFDIVILDGSPVPTSALVINVPPTGSAASDEKK